MSSDVLRFPVVLPPREGTFGKRLAALTSRAYTAYVEARMRKAAQEVARHRAFHLDPTIEEAELSAARLGTLPFVR